MTGHYARLDCNFFSSLPCNCTASLTFSTDSFTSLVFNFLAFLATTSLVDFPPASSLDESVIGLPCNYTASLTVSATSVAFLVSQFVVILVGVFVVEGFPMIFLYVGVPLFVKDQKYIPTPPQ